MKILFIGTEKYDYLQDLTYSGLVKILGVKRVIESNWNKNYHINLKTYPKNIGYTPSSLIPSILNRSIDKPDFLFVASNRPDCIKSYLEILPKIPPTTKTIFIDGGDRSEIGGDIVRLTGNEQLRKDFLETRPFDFVFKREYIKGKDYPANVNPLPISFNFNKLPANISLKKKYDVAFWAVASHEIREKVFDLLESEFDFSENGSGRGQVMKKYKRKGNFYFRELAATKISLNFRGGGWDTLRYWEVPAVGACMLSQKLDMIIPNDFVPNKHILNCENDLSDLEEVCEFYLKNDSKREKIAKSGGLHAKKYHSDIARANYILDIIGCSA